LPADVERRFLTTTRVRSALAWRVNGVVPYWVLLAAGAVLIATTADVLNGGWLTSLDHAISRRMLATGLRDTTWRKSAIYLLTQFGQRGTVLVVSVPVIVWLAWSRRQSEPLVRYFVALASLTLVVYGLKGYVGRHAPPRDGIHTAIGASFPSGHLANGILVWGLLAWSCSRWATPAWLTRLGRIVAVVGPCAVVIGMTLLNYHWFSDFVAGAAIGVLLLGLTLAPIWTTVSARLDARMNLTRRRDEVS
jgi:membrane-associated phospholipid phosphatase